MNDFEFVKQYDPLASDIYKDRKYYFLTYNEIAELRGLKVSRVKELYDVARDVLKDREHAWMIGLHCRARNALTRTGYSDFSTLYEDVITEKIDLEQYSGIGHKVAVEIRKWLVKSV